MAAERRATFLTGIGFNDPNNNTEAAAAANAEMREMWDELKELTEIWDQQGRASDAIVAAMLNHALLRLHDAPDNARRMFLDNMRTALALNFPTSEIVQ